MGFETALRSCIGTFLWLVVDACLDRWGCRCGLGWPGWSEAGTMDVLRIKLLHKRRQKSLGVQMTGVGELCSGGRRACPNKNQNFWRAHSEEVAVRGMTRPLESWLFFLC